MNNIHPLRCGFGMAFLIESDNGLYLVDSGSPGQHQIILDRMQQLGRSHLRLIWITHAHYDHFGSAQALPHITGASIGIHPADASSMQSGSSPLGSSHRYGFIYSLAQWLLERLKPLSPTRPDFTLNHQQSLLEFGLDATVLHTPGHTSGHTCLLLADGTVFAGDLLGAFPTPGLQRLLASDWSQLPASLAILKSAKPRLVFTGHSLDPFSGEMLFEIH